MHEDHQKTVAPAMPTQTTISRLSTDRGVWLVTKRLSGSPHVTPVWFVYDHPSVSWWISTGEDSVKVRNIRRQAEVTLALEDSRAPVVAEGIASIRSQPFPAKISDAFARKYDGWDITIPYRPGSTRVLIEIATRRWLFGAG